MSSPSTRGTPARSAFASSMEALSLLAESDPFALAQSASLRVLHERCVSSGLCEGGARDDAARLHSLFDAALEGNLVSVIVHYVHEARAAAAPAQTLSLRRLCRCVWTRSPCPATPPART